MNLQKDLKYGKKIYRKNISCIVLYIFIYANYIYDGFSFNESRYTKAFTGFSLKWYMELFKDESIMKVFQTLIITGIATIFALIIGTIGAWSIYRAFNPKLRSYFMNVTYLPLILPDIVIAIGMIILYVFFKLNFGYFTIILSHIIFNIPFVVFAILPKLLTFDKSLYDAGMDLGAKQFQVFKRIVLPQLIPNLIIGALVLYYYVFR